MPSSATNERVMDGGLGGLCRQPGLRPVQVAVEAPKASTATAGSRDLFSEPGPVFRSGVRFVVVALLAEITILTIRIRFLALRLAQTI